MSKYEFKILFIDHIQTVHVIRNLYGFSLLMHLLSKYSSTMYMYIAIYYDLATVFSETLISPQGDTDLDTLFFTCFICYIYFYHNKLYFFDYE